jgi:hypothetical protein
VAINRDKDAERRERIDAIIDKYRKEAKTLQERIEKTRKRALKATLRPKAYRRTKTRKH